MPGPTDQAGLLDLLDDILLRITAHLSLQERLRLPEVCRKWRGLLAGPSEAWRQVEAVVVLDEHESWPPGAAGSPNTPLQSFCRWLQPRLAGLEELRLALDATRLLPMAQPPCLPADLLLLGTVGEAAAVAAATAGPLPLAKLSIQWHGSAMLGWGAGAMGLPLRNLRKLAFPGGTRLWVSGSSSIADDLPSLTDFGLIDGLLVGELDTPWLPPSVTMLALAAVGLTRLPGVLAHLPRLQSLVLDHNYEIGSAPLNGLTQLTALQELNLSECALTSFPHQISALSSLRILYLHNTFADAADLAPVDWEPLRALRHLVFLSISGNSLHHVPTVVLGLTQLRGLHLEDNLITRLPAGAPVLAGLRELLLDWRAALGSPASLAGAAALTRLILNDHLALELGPGAHPGAVGALLRTLGALSALRRIDDVVPEGMVTSISTAVAHAMWQLGRACPHVELGTMAATNAGWTLSSLVAGLPHNDGLALLVPAGVEGGGGESGEAQSAVAAAAGPAG
ncbi:hypothetical protein ABPG75_011334 [Micractinium tetrahymenae]